MFKYKFLFLILSFPLFWSCSFTYREIHEGKLTDVSDRLTYDRISRMPFMGGSMLYNVESPFEGQLQKNSVVAIRLGNVCIKYQDDENIVFSDTEDSAIYGYLKINCISDSFVDFDFFVYDNEVLSFMSKNFILYEDDYVDLNSDGFYDLTYRKNTVKRAGLKNTYLLEFLSSQENLNTTMFSLITEQYSRNTYPIGLIGINPNGRFVVALYENGTSNRSSVLGLKYGDYVFDSVECSYRKLVTKRQFKSARSISDNELELVDAPASVNFYFTTDQFVQYGLSPINFLELIKESLSDVLSTEQAVEKLNLILEDRNLIQELSDEFSITLSNEVKDIDTSILTIDELVSLNRFFLTEYFPNYVPSIDFNNNDISEVFPLLSLLLPQNEAYAIENERAVNYSTYISERKKLEKEINSYYSFDFLSNYKASKQLPKLSAKIGVFGKYSISWSNVEGSLAALCFVQAESELVLKESKKGSLLQTPIKFLNITKDIMVGYIPLSIGLTGKIDVNYSVSANMVVDANLFVGYTGLYGGKISVGADYGTRWVKWFKVWRHWFYRPKIYVNPYAKGNFINKTVYFIGFQNDPNCVSGTLKACVTPNVSLTPKVGLCHNTVWIGLMAENGVSLGVDVTSNLQNTTGVGYVDIYLRLNGKAGLDLTLPFINKSLDKDFSVFTVTPVNSRVAKWNIL